MFNLLGNLLSQWTTPFFPFSFWCILWKHVFREINAGCYLAFVVCLIRVLSCPVQLPLHAWRLSQIPSSKIDNYHHWFQWHLNSYIIKYMDIYERKKKKKEKPLLDVSHWTQQIKIYSQARRVTCLNSSDHLNNITINNHHTFALSKLQQIFTNTRAINFVGQNKVVQEREIKRKIKCSRPQSG